MRRGFLGTAAVFAALSIAPAQASAAEHVLDGSFDAVTSCMAADCTSPVWSDALGGGAGTGPLCEIGIGSCGYFQGPMGAGPLSGTKWAQLGGETSMSGSNTYSIQQVVSMPTGPATLSFQLRTRSSNASTGAFTVRIDGTPIFTVGGSEIAYTPISVDVSAFAGGLRTLRFEVANANNNGSTDSFNVDDVSLIDQPAQPTPVTPQVTTPAAKKCPKGKKLKKGKCRKKKRKKKG